MSRARALSNPVPSLGRQVREPGDQGRHWHYGSRRRVLQPELQSEDPTEVLVVFPGSQWCFQVLRAVCVRHSSEVRNAETAGTFLWFVGWFDDRFQIESGIENQKICLLGGHTQRVSWRGVCHGDWPQRTINFPQTEEPPWDCLVTEIRP